jgi:hypothetical protein
MPAETYNRLMDMLRWWFSSGMGGGAGDAVNSRDLVTIRIENASDTDLDQFGILGISGSAVFPTRSENEGEFNTGPLFSGELPDVESHRGRFAVVLEPVANGQMCRAAIAGVVPVYVKVQDADDWWADVDDGEHATLASGKSGAAQLLYRPGSSGSVWCLARLGGGFPYKPTYRYQILCANQEDLTDIRFDWGRLH